MDIENDWVKIGNNLIPLDELRGVWIQKNHLIIEIDTQQDQLVFHFGKEGYEECKKAFDKLCELKKAFEISLSENVNLTPDIMKTFYEDEFNRTVKAYEKFELDKVKKRYQKQMDKLKNKLTEMANKLEKAHKK